MKLKKIIVATSLMSAVILNAGFMDIVSGATDIVSGATKTESKGTGDAQCIPRMSGGSASFTEMITKQVISIAIDKALQSMTGDKSIESPRPIMDTCEADKRLVYLNKLTTDFNGVVVGANEDIDASLDKMQKIQKLEAQAEHVKETEAATDFDPDADLDDMTKNTLALASQYKIKDKELYSQAMGKLAISTPISGYLVIGWDKEILEFAKDNIVWGIQNVSALTDVASQAVTIMGVLPTLATLATNPLYDGRVDKSVAKKAAKAQTKSSKELAKIAEEDGGFEG